MPSLARPTTLAVTVKPNAATTVVSMAHGTVQVRVKAQAREGKANDASRIALAKALGVAPSTVTLVRGAHARVKIFALATLTPAELAVRLARLRP
jgi:uncharacterized protein